MRFENGIYDEDVGSRIIDNLLKTHDISIRKYSASDCGLAWINKREIKIPKKINSPYRFLIALHEISHILDGYKKMNYIQEYYAEINSIKMAVKYGLKKKDLLPYIRIAKWNVFRVLCNDFDGKLDEKKIRKDVLKWLGINTRGWKSNNIYCGIFAERRGYKSIFVSYASRKTHFQKLKIIDL